MPAPKIWENVSWNFQIPFFVLKVHTKYVNMCAKMLVDTHIFNRLLDIWVESAYRLISSIPRFPTWNRICSDPFVMDAQRKGSRVSQGRNSSTTWLPKTSNLKVQGVQLDWHTLNWHQIYTTYSYRRPHRWTLRAHLAWGQLRTWDGHGDSGWAQRVRLRGPSVWPKRAL